LRWASVSDARILGVRSSRIVSATAIFRPWSVGTTSSSVRTLAIMPSRGGCFFASAERAGDRARLLRVVGQETVGVTYVPRSASILRPQ
jgi:hypothetical protein